MNGKTFLAVVPDFSATSAVRFYFRPRHGGQRLSSGCLQEPAASRHHGHQHGIHGNLGRRHAPDRRIPVHPRN